MPSPPTGGAVGGATYASIVSALPDPEPWTPLASGLCPLPDGRRLSFLEFGDPAGTPVVWCHGTPGGASEATVAAASARELGVRLISPSRPGMGLSDARRGPRPGGRVIDWPDGLAHLADHLDLGSFGLLGVSGGGPFALATALRLPERLTGVALLAPAGPPSGRQPPRWLLRAAGAAMQAPIVPAALGVLAPLVNPAFRRLPREASAGMIRAAREGATPAGAQEMLLHTHGDWGFDPADVRLRGIRVWQGLKDLQVRPAETRALAARLPEASLIELPAEDHLSLIGRHAEVALAWLAAQGRP